MPVRTTVYLEEEVLERVRRVVPPRGLSQFINEALVEKTETLERQAIEQAMKEGYLATGRTAGDREALSADWEAVDTESWPA